MAKFSSNTIIGIVISFILIATLLPVGLDSLFAMVLPETAPDILSTLLLTLLPIAAVLGIVMYFLPKQKRD